MSTPNPRLGRLGSPSTPSNRTPYAPVCRHCTTDYYLKFMAIIPAAVTGRATTPLRRKDQAPARDRAASTSRPRPETDNRHKSLGRFKRFIAKFGAESPGRSGGRVEYFCQKCGNLHKHDFPAGWEPPTRTLTERDLQALPTLYVGPGESRPTVEVTGHILGLHHHSSTSV